MVISSLALLAQISSAYLGSTIWGGWAAFLAFLYILSFVYFVFLIISTILFTPIDYPIKQYLVSKAKRKILRLQPKLKIVGTTGSYGKTTTKEVVASVLSQGFKVLKTPENFNTPLGIARFILKDVSDSTEVLVIEMGAYRRGDIKKLCALTPPDVVILTGINESHLERFGSLENTIEAKFEIVKALKGSGFAVLNADDNLVVKNYKRFCGENLYFYSSSKHPLASIYTERVRFDPENLRLELVLNRDGDKYNFSVPFLGKYIAGTIGAAIIVASKLGLSRAQIEKGITQLRPSPHRLEVVSNKNKVVVIDDSYNGNPDGVREAINALSQFKQSRRIYVTPGLVEMGSVSAKVHERIGEELASVASLVILIRNSVTGHIADGLKRQGFPVGDIMWFDTARAARAALPNIVRAGDVILFQNDWPENYI
ncbi:hypothetical protein A3A64_03955 [Candidatus Gottesmanbacteria bacterium RIFCSPLOWO2_01_FULL_48_11]|uniref:UDP-N-acetylmuramoyl-tripeptide--D-alanyl-D-alanine ligase n=3 Tax=Patescibacteria group TaxID=1783273 RepID=A0A1F6AUT1_9BACT|nr:MAG: UDP-N-acetylmuramoyl-tripeptide-D-alanyl-D-alanine ligase [Parcubacteria group bacterium GW2011_GWA2_46_10]KKU21429.1 MAG: UDP-N-acetylmuramoyl-tripeptide-D-alanyl-D-alanine ligase [Candidatus Nomurabacteria bacterium GW2011_GWA1_46_11]OGG28430.1 MAG: hypothetical protein A3A64_03955 [Candidatus Gottesmanbacteria bacterium RIFCSPLOWO2_01_FULL_48_11]OGY56330.1 MAG: hypothetical protein A2119_02065 [Candidatus Colwellbacteria bacterium GWA2_46_10]